MDSLCTQLCCELFTGRMNVFLLTLHHLPYHCVYEQHVQFEHHSQVFTVFVWENTPAN